MLASLLRAVAARRQSNQPGVPPAVAAFFLLLLSVSALTSMVVGVFLLAGAWGFIAMGVALVLLEWRIDAN